MRLSWVWVWKEHFLPRSSSVDFSLILLQSRMATLCPVPRTMPVTQRQPMHARGIYGPHLPLWNICQGAAAILAFPLLVCHYLVWQFNKIRVVAGPPHDLQPSAAPAALPPILSLTTVPLSIFASLWDWSSYLLTMTRDCQSHESHKLA